MKLEGTYVGWGTKAVVFQAPDGDCLKVYRKEFGRDLADKEIRLFNKFHDEGLRVPQPKEVVGVEFDSSSLDQIADETLRQDCAVGGTFFALRKEFIEGRIMGKRWLPSFKIRRSYNQLNKAMFAMGYTPADFIPHNYVVTPGKDVYLIDADRVQEISPKQIREEIIGMNAVPVTHFGRAWFDITRKAARAFFGQSYG